MKPIQGKHFYSHIIEFESLLIELHKMELNSQEKQHLISLIESNMHQEILDVILSELSEEDKKIFLEHVACEEHDKVWEHLNKKIANIEEKIKKAAEDLKKQLHQDIKEI